MPDVHTNGTGVARQFSAGSEGHVVELAPLDKMLGHKSATMTLDLYGHLFPDQLDEVADRMDAAARSLSLPRARRASVTPIGSSVRRQADLVP